VSGRGRLSIGAFALFAAVALVIGCAHLPKYAVPGVGGSPTPGDSPSPGASSSPGSSPTPADCGSPATDTTAFIAMTTTATATIDPTYGEVSGYTDQFDQFGDPSNVANVIDVNPTAVIQFVNLEPLGPQPSPSATPDIIDHSAAALPTAFPSPEYQFPSDELLALGTEVSTQAWSTGPIGQDFYGGTICYSQAFTVPSGGGAFAFGDLTYFGLSNMRDVIVVSTTAEIKGTRYRRLRRATPAP
jgi:hypothetical protein